MFMEDLSSCGRNCLALRAETIYCLALYRKKNLSIPRLKEIIVTIFYIVIIFSITVSSSFIPAMPGLWSRYSVLRRLRGSVS